MLTKGQNLLHPLKMLCKEIKSLLPYLVKIVLTESSHPPLIPQLNDV